MPNKVADGGAVPGEIVEHQAHAVGHAAVAEGPEVAAHFAADLAYLDALRRGEDAVDARRSARQPAAR